MMRLLLVEDELEIQSFVKQSLTDAGYEVHTAENGNAATLLAAKQVYQGMIIDLGLPDQDGIDLILQLRKSGISVLCRVDFVARARQRLLDKALNIEFVLDQQESHHSILLRLDRPCPHCVCRSRVHHG